MCTNLSVHGQVWGLAFEHGYSITNISCLPSGKESNCVCRLSDLTMLAAQVAASWPKSYGLVLNHFLVWLCVCSSTHHSPSKGTLLYFHQAMNQSRLKKCTTACLSSLTGTIAPHDLHLLILSSLELILASFLLRIHPNTDVPEATTSLQVLGVAFDHGYSPRNNNNNNHPWERLVPPAPLRVLCLQGIQTNNPKIDQPQEPYVNSRQNGTLNLTDNAPFFLCQGLQLLSRDIWLSISTENMQLRKLNCCISQISF